MKLSRILIAGAAAIGVVGGAQAQSCIRSTETEAFNVRALQSQLMVAMLQCGPESEAKYGQFITRYRTELNTAFQTISTSYRRSGGNPAMDSYITTMANAQSQDGIKQGTRFCANAAPMFDSALASPNNSASLAQLAVLNNLSNPHGRSDCPAGAAPVAAERPARAARPARARR